MAKVKEKFTLDKTVTDIISDIIVSQKHSSSENIDFIISLLSAKENGVITRDAGVVIKNYLNPNNYSRTKNDFLINLYKKYQYVHDFITLSLEHKKNIKAQLLPFYKTIKK